ncbi:MAG: S-methyl-5-thioribose-1-phosphate isomerase [Caldiserica bacterium]|nr:S-methyl-5-thioribose-1-phosphate isomerase [Caldisericota bacterium]
MEWKPVSWEGDSLRVLDQTLLPGEERYLNLRSVEEVWEAIINLRVRGAPLLGIVGAFGVYIGIRDSEAKSGEEFLQEIDKVIDYIGSSRPTAVNLFWAMKRIKEKVSKSIALPVQELKMIILSEAIKILKEDDEICRGIGAAGAGIIKDGDSILTHCNAGGLATSGYGTALAVLYCAREEGKVFRVYADETRPLLQGARLTCWELNKAGIETYLICDDMAGEVMRERRVNKVIVGADRIANNGDTANKIGSYSLAILAHYHNIPFYIAAPLSTIDWELGSGEGIPIELRKEDEVTQCRGVKIAPCGIKVYNPAFDVVPNKLITGIITEKGIVYPPYERNLPLLRAE